MTQNERRPGGWCRSVRQFTIPGAFPQRPKPPSGHSNGLQAIPQQRLHMMTSCTPNMFAAFITMPCGGNTERCGQIRTVFEVVWPAAIYADLWPRTTRFRRRSGYPHKPERQEKTYRIPPQRASAAPTVAPAPPPSPTSQPRIAATT